MPPHETRSLHHRRPGHRFAGPAVVVSEDTTVWLGPTERATVDEYGNLIIDVGQASDVGAGP